MAGLEGFADMEAACSSFKEGPVLTMINKRLRAFKKKYNRILQIEETKAQGKQINKEQEEVLKGKLAMAVLIEEYEKLRSPLMMAVKEEVEKEIMEMKTKIDERHAAEDEEEHSDVDVHEKNITEVRLGIEERSGRDYDERADAHMDADVEATYNERLHSEKPDNVELEDANRHNTELPYPLATSLERDIGDLLHLLYFSQLFDVPRADSLHSLVWTKVHERTSCVSYDCVTEDDTSSPLEEDDLNDLSLLGSLIISRPPDVTPSHQDALQQCVRHALLWLGNSDTPISEGPSVTYSHLRERLNRILSSKYYTVELQKTAAAAAGQYAPHFLVHAGTSAIESEQPSFYFANQDQSPELLLQGLEHYPASLPANNMVSEISESQMFMNSEVTFTPETNAVADVDQGAVAGAGSTPRQEKEQQDPLQGVPQDLEEQVQELKVANASVDQRGYQQGPNGGGAPGGNHVAGGRGRNYTNGRGGYGINRGGYGSGRNAQLQDQKVYYPRNQYVRGTGRGGTRSGSSTFNGYNNGQPNNRASGGGPA